MTAFFSAFSSSKLEKYPKKRGWSEKLNTFPYIRIQVKKGNGYLISDFKREEFQMVKHRSSIRLCWRMYCKRAAKQNLKAYSRASFVVFYGQFRKPYSDEYDPKNKVRNKLKHYNLMLSYCNPNGEQYQKLKKEKEEWLKSLHLDESKIVDKTYEL